MSYVVRTDGWIVDGRPMVPGETVPNDVLTSLGDLEPFLDGGYIYEEGGVARVPVSPSTGEPVVDAAVPDQEKAAE